MWIATVSEGHCCKDSLKINEYFVQYSEKESKHIKKYILAKISTRNWLRSSHEFVVLPTLPEASFAFAGKCSDIVVGN